MLELLHRIQLPDNEARQSAEQQLAAQVAADPSGVASALLGVAQDAGLHTAIRQSALLNLKRIVPLHWSAGFESFQGLAIAQDVKARVRAALLALVTGDPDSKIRNGASYCAVQIAAVDYPDEWPTLLTELYARIDTCDTVSMLGGLTLLEEIFDDLITEEHFFETGVGLATISECVKLLANPDVLDHIKYLAVSLYKVCLLQLQNPEFLDDDAKSRELQHHFGELVRVLDSLLHNQAMAVHTIMLRSGIYSILSVLNTEFPDGFVQLGDSLQVNLLNDIITTSQAYVDIVVLQNEDKLTGNADSDISVPQVFNNLLIEQFALLATLDGVTSSSANTPSLTYFYDSILGSCFITLRTESLWLADFNEFVSQETEVSADFTARNAVFDYVMELDQHDLNNIFRYCATKLIELEPDSNWRSKESLLYLLSLLLRNDHQLHTGHDLDIGTIFSKTTAFIEDANVLVRSRAILVVPDLIKKFASVLGKNALDCFLKSLQTAVNESNHLLSASFLISLTVYNSVLDFATAVPKETQAVAFQLISSMLDEAELDTPPLLAESVNVLIKINAGAAPSIDALNLILEISLLDPSNLQLNIDSSDALETLLSGTTMHTYLAYLQHCLPNLLAKIDSFGSISFEFNSQLNLLMEFLNILIKTLPPPHPQNSLPLQIFNLINNTITKVIETSNDDQILQIAGETFNSLINVSSVEMFDINMVLQILSKFLNPQLSDSAAMNVGSLVISTIKKFDKNIANLLPEILEATTKRLLIAQELSTIEDLLSVLCFMISINVEQCIEFLKKFQIEQQVLNIWFKTFELLKGDNIKENCLAFIKIYLSGVQFEFEVDDELQNLETDLIITRSMKHLKQYKKISVPSKLIKLLVFELRNQDHNHEDEDEDGFDQVFDQPNEPEEAAQGGEEDWEDVDEIKHSFSKLQQYAGQHSNQNGNEINDENMELKQILINFFKLVASKNINNFESIYEQLSDDDKQLLAENIV